MLLLLSESSLAFLKMEKPKSLHAGRKTKEYHGGYTAFWAHDDSPILKQRHKRYSYKTAKDLANSQEHQGASGADF